METKNEWFEDIKPDSPEHLKQWAKNGLPLQAKHHITKKGVEIFSIAKNFKIVRK